MSVRDRARRKHESKTEDTDDDEFGHLSFDNLAKQLVPGLITNKAGRASTSPVKDTGSHQEGTKNVRKRSEMHQYKEECVDKPLSTDRLLNNRVSEENDDDGGRIFQPIAKKARAGKDPEAIKKNSSPLAKSRLIPTATNLHIQHWLGTTSPDHHHSDVTTRDSDLQALQETSIESGFVPLAAVSTSDHNWTNSSSSRVSFADGSSVLPPWSQPEFDFWRTWIRISACWLQRFRLPAQHVWIR